MIRLLFAIPVTNAELERMFSKLKPVKTYFCDSLGVKQLEYILRIMEKGNSWGTFDAILKKWGVDTVRHTTKETRWHNYQPCNSAKVNVKSVSDDDDSYNEEENICENGHEVGYCFFFFFVVAI